MAGSVGSARHDLDSVVVFPVVLGAGERRFGQTSDKPMRLVDTKTIGDGLDFLTYQACPRCLDRRPIAWEQLCQVWACTREHRLA